MVQGAAGRAARGRRLGPVRFFVPPYVGGKGWIGAYLDVDQDWEELADLIDESYRMTAPNKLVDRL